ncbi:MAG: Adenylosuccinate lyase [Candidatus Roizmanbacteria bacterium GW2011_GWC2_37_13]|uniref:Adenylosuccinate lyase n=1 Tax=Candidatus Roizmanbacteria bacterium GW2011_GWC2_37_13 TaxID=1618486 RepID=A0A0G0G053_9BACT|nr:MAG: Adenylosuccinate lyase [Candidatus Roizmanbacteria bacterium GW2011_GWC1_37_12]KKQ24573.1 MAG: Adenylosuccinate lyase [Candidatus Roizmanbacteria bacterium GW2011_GWC2_37_13]
MSKNLSSFDHGLAITPLDGRNFLKIKDLSGYFSEFALNKYRVRVELEYLIKLSEWKIIRKLTTKELTSIKRLIEVFDFDNHKEIKIIENKINHDVKAVEYFLREKFKKTSLKDLVPFVHLGLTSEDINNLAYGLMLKEFKENIFEKELLQLINQLKQMATEYKSIPMLARTHGQPAVGTTVGKELVNYVYRLKKQLKKTKEFEFEGKCNGAVGNNNALQTAIPSKNWLKLSEDFVKSLGLTPNPYTTQILFYDNWIEFFQIVSLVNGILIDFSINMWGYIMLETFIQKKKDKEIGSSTMPQKINPINFENAEGNLQLANSLFEFFERKLIHSRLQRDLSDSTIRRNFGESLGYTVLGWRNIRSGLEKLFVNKDNLKEELNKHWEILTEAIQTVLRLKGDKKGYEKMKMLVRGKTINSGEYLKILKGLGLEKDKRLVNLSPEKYVGFASELVEKLR